MYQFLVSNMLYIILLFATAFVFFWIQQFKHIIKINDITALIIAVIHTLIGVFCVKLFAFLESGNSGAMSLYGAIFFLPLIYYISAIIFKRKIADVFDIFTICLFSTLAFSRINCLFVDCCLGLLIPGTEIRFPTRELEILFYIILFILLRRKVCSKKYSGLIYPIYLIAYGTFRFIVEWLREGEPVIGLFHISHVWSLFAILIGLLSLNLIKIHKLKNFKHGKNYKN